MPCFNEEQTVKEILDRSSSRRWSARSSSTTRRPTPPSRYCGPTTTPGSVLAQPVNCGKGAALRLGFAEATKQFVIVRTPISSTTRASTPRCSVRCSTTKPTWCTAHDSAAAMPGGSSTSGTRSATGVTLASNMATNLNLSDMETCYKAFRREIIQGIDIEEDRFGFEPEVTAKIAALHCRVYEVGSATTAARTTTARRSAGATEFVRRAAIAAYSLRASVVRTTRSLPSTHRFVSERAMRRNGAHRRPDTGHPDAVLDPSHDRNDVPVEDLHGGRRRGFLTQEPHEQQPAEPARHVHVARVDHS